MLMVNHDSKSLISGSRRSKHTQSARSNRSKVDRSTLLAEFQQQMVELEQAMSKELRIKCRKINKLQRELNETQDYFRELVYLIEEVLQGKNPLAASSANKNKNLNQLDRSLQQLN